MEVPTTEASDVAALNRQNRPAVVSQTAETHHLPWWQLAIYGASAVPVYAFLIPMAFFLPPFFTGELGLSLTAWGLIILLARLWDMIVDPLTGVLRGRLFSRWGRRRHWLVLSMPMMMLACIILFTPQIFIDKVILANGLVAMFSLHVVQTINGLNGQAWARSSPTIITNARVFSVGALDLARLRPFSPLRFR